MWWYTYGNQKKILYILIALIASWIILTIIVKNQSKGEVDRWIKRCYKEGALKTAEVVDFFDEFTTTTESFKDHEPIMFFHQTSCSMNGRIQLSPVQACAIESAARLNTNTKIIVLFASPQGITPHGIESMLARTLLSYPNVRFYNVNLWQYIRGSIAENWLLEGKLFDHHHPPNAILDFLRLFTLYKYGGTCVDLNSIITKQLEFIPPNYFNAISPNATTIDVINLQSTGIGNSIAKSLLLDYINGLVDTKQNQGLNVIARVSKKLCNTEQFDTAKPLICNGIRVLPKQTFQTVAFTPNRKYKTTPPITVTTTILDAWNNILTNYYYSADSTYVDVVLAHCPSIFRTTIRP